MFVKLVEISLGERPVGAARLETVNCLLIVSIQSPSVSHQSLELNILWRSKESIQ